MLTPQQAKRLAAELFDDADESAAGTPPLPLGEGRGEGLPEQIMDFLLERFRAWYQDENIPNGVFQAVLAVRPASPLDFDQRIRAVNHFAALKDASALAAANKRVSNILLKQNTPAEEIVVNTALLSEKAEILLADLINNKISMVAPLFAARDYTKVLESLAPVRQAVDNFFDQVLVMTEDKNLRNNRIALLSELRQLFLQVADISLLQSEK